MPEEIKLALEMLRKSIERQQQAQHERHKEVFERIAQIEGQLVAIHQLIDARTDRAVLQLEFILRETLKQHGLEPK